jgi:hypothetical protein
VKQFRPDRGGDTREFLQLQEHFHQAIGHGAKELLPACCSAKIKELVRVPPPFIPTTMKAHLP